MIVCFPIEGKEQLPQIPPRYDTFRATHIEAARACETVIACKKT